MFNSKYFAQHKVGPAIPVAYSAAGQCHMLKRYYAAGSLLSNQHGGGMAPALPGTCLECSVSLAPSAPSMGCLRREPRRIVAMLDGGSHADHIKLQVSVADWCCPGSVADPPYLVSTQWLLAPALYCSAHVTACVCSARLMFIDAVRRANTLAAAQHLGAGRTMVT